MDAEQIARAVGGWGDGPSVLPKCCQPKDENTPFDWDHILNVAIHSLPPQPPTDVLIGPYITPEMRGLLPRDPQTGALYPDENDYDLNLDDPIY